MELGGLAVGAYGQPGGWVCKNVSNSIVLLPNYFLLIKNTIIALLNSILILQKQV